MSVNDTEREGAEHSDAVLTKRAALRAKITAYLKGHPGRHKVGDVADALKADVNLVGKMLAEMAENKQVELLRQGPSKLYGIGEVPNLAGGKDVVVLPTHGRQKGVRVAMKELELVVAGFTVVLTRNPENGRPRIVIDQGS